MQKNDLISLPAGNDSFSRIKLFLSNQESGIVLSAKEEKQLQRYILANALLTERKFTREEIANKIKEIHGVSYWTARHDIDSAYTLHSQITEDYKRYTLFLHIEDIDRTIQKWSNDKSMAQLLVKLYDAKTKAIAAMPVQTVNPDVPAPVINMNVTNNINVVMEKDDAIREADRLITYEQNHEYTEFEDMKNDRNKSKSE